MKNAIAILLGSVMMVCFGCKSEWKKKVPLTFFDSVMAKMQLSHQQMLKHTIVDTGLYHTAWSDTDSSRIPGFTGDTCYTNVKCPIAIVYYSDAGTCGRKFLLVYRNSKNTACQEVYTSCDDDGDDQDYSYLDYKIVNEHLFYTLETFENRARKLKDKIIVTKHSYKIDDKGKINELGSKLVSVTYRDKDTTE